MKLFQCHNCGLLLYFENTRCERCEHILGYIPERTELSALTTRNGNIWHPLNAPGERYRFCANADHDACNWLIYADGPDSYCRACQLNRTIPDLGVPENLLHWQRIEAAKHRLVYGLLRLSLYVAGKFQDAENGLAFDFLSGSGTMFHDSPPVVTGHMAGVITIDIGEADPAERERHRQEMIESYRTLLGHFRHEIGHYYWERLIRNGVWHDAFRQMFGDESQDYAAALEAHYANGPQAGWQSRYVSAYASCHPWEDFAETWAHYLHIVDTLETASAFGLCVHPDIEHEPAIELDMEIDFDPYQQADFNALIAPWVPLTAAVNSLNQSMGQPDMYPFVLAPTVIGKLRFVHGLVHDDNPTNVVG